MKIRFINLLIFALILVLVGIFTLVYTIESGMIIVHWDRIDDNGERIHDRSTSIINAHTHQMFHRRSFNMNDKLLGNDPSVNDLLETASKSDISSPFHFPPNKIRNGNNKVDSNDKNKNKRVASTTTNNSNNRSGKKKVIVFSLFDRSGKGRPDEYFISGLIHNLALARVVYPDWTVRIYCADDIKPDFIKVLKKCNAEIIRLKFETSKWMDGMFWRFYPADDNSIERFIVRDLDGRLSWRERIAVDKWISEGTAFHSIKDHRLHSIPVMGGMWGGVGGMMKYARNNKKTMKELCDAYPNKRSKGADQSFLVQIYNMLKHNMTEHNSNKGTFPPNSGTPKYDLKGYFFVGAAYGKDRVKNTIICDPEPPKCYHTCRAYQKDYQEMTGEIFPDSLYGKYDLSKSVECEHIDCERDDVKC